MFYEKLCQRPIDGSISRRQEDHETLLNARSCEANLSRTEAFEAPSTRECETKPPSIE